jgi:hypothetical protein
VHEGFSVSKIIEIYNSVILEDTASKNPIALHFDVSPFANLHLLNRFLYQLFLSSLLVDEVNGKSEFLRGNNHLIYVELPALKKSLLEGGKAAEGTNPFNVNWPSESVKSITHPYLGVLSCVRIAATSSGGCHFISEVRSIKHMQL